MQNFSWATLFIKKDAKGENEADGQPEIQMRIILVLLHEESRPVKNREIELITRVLCSFTWESFVRNRLLIDPCSFQSFGFIFWSISWQNKEE